MAIDLFFLRIYEAMTSNRPMALTSPKVLYENMKVQERSQAPAYQEYRPQHTFTLKIDCISDFTRL